MSGTSGTAGSLPTAELDRRFYAFTLDRLLAWTIYAVAVWGAWVLLIDRGRTGAGIGVIVGTVVVVSVVFSFVLGLLGTTPGKAAVGLRVVDDTTGTPIGVGPALLRTVVLGVAALPTFGLGVATLAWTAVMDVDHKRRGWHDHLVTSVVVDVRPVPTEEEAAPERPRHIVNLTAMRLVPASPTPPREVPARVRRSRWATGPSGAAVTSAAPTPVVASEPAPETLAAAVRPPEPIAVQPVAPQPVAPQPVAAQPPAPEPVATAPAPPAPTAPDPDALVTPPTATRSRPAAVAPVDLGDALGAAAPEETPAALAGRRSTPRPAPRHAAGPDRAPAPAPAPGPAPEQPAATPRPAVWSVSFDTGDAFVVEGFTLVGRNPEPRPGEPVKRLVALPSSDMSLSKTHAQFQVVPDGALVVMDRGSTNGSLLIRAGVTRELGPGKPATLRDGDRVRFGDREMRVVRET